MNVIISVGLICAGLYVVYEELFVSYSGIHGRYGLLGWVWLYSVAPLFGCGFIVSAR